MGVSVSLLSLPILAPLQLQFQAQARNKPVNLFQSPGQGKGVIGSQLLWQPLQQQPSPALAPYSPSMFLLPAPTLPDTSPLILHTALCHPHSTLTLQLHTLTHPSYTPCFSLILLPPLCTEALEKFSMQVSSHPLPTLHTPTLHHTLSFTHKCPLACPPHSPLSPKTRWAPLPQGPWLPHTVCTHCFTQIPRRRLPSTPTAIQKIPPHRHFPSLSLSSLGPPGHPPPGPLYTHAVHSPSVPGSAVHSHTHTHTHTIKHPTS